MVMAGSSSSSRIRDGDHHRDKFYVQQHHVCKHFLISSICLWLVMVVSSKVMTTEAAPIPAPNLPYDCNSEERCCMPRPYKGKPAKNFTFDTTLPMRVRRPVHLLDQDYISKLERAYDLIRALPDTDPRSLLNQMNLHCLYCDNGIYYPNVTFPLEIHNGWLFLPWHRMFIYFHERILAKLLGDDTFALPYWNWDNQSPYPPYANIFPHIYAKKNSSLWDEYRNKCSEPSNIIDLNTMGGCTNKSASKLRTENQRLMYAQLVDGAPLPSLFYGMPYHLGDVGGAGPGTFEDNPHGTVHAWVGDPSAPVPFNDMGNFGRSARDPVFYAHHANVDRVWTIWKTIPGGIRQDPTSPDWQNSEFTYYDEDANLVVVKISQALDIDRLRYKYEYSEAKWTTNGVAAGMENSIPQCNPTSESQVYAMIASTKPLTDTTELYYEPISFRVRRPAVVGVGTEVLEIQGIKLNATIQAHIDAYLFFPTADGDTSVGCPEFFATFNFVPHVGQASFNPERLWRASLGPKLQALGKDYVSHIVVTLVQVGHSIQPLRFREARIVYDDNSQM